MTTYDANVHDKGIINVTASSLQTSSTRPKYAADVQSSTTFWSWSDENAWLCYEFKEGRQVRPSDYLVRSSGEEAGGCHLRSWVFEGSGDGQSWIVLDAHEDNAEPNDPFAEGTFEISPVRKDKFRFQRLRQTGYSHCPGSYIMAISALEIGGTLIH